MLKLRFFIAAIVTLWLAGGVHFGQTTGAIWGEVFDESKEPLPGVLVTASSSALVAGRAVSTDKSGRFQLAVLPPGEYSLKLTLDGYQSLEMSEIPVRLGAATPVKVGLKYGPSVEIVKVTMPPHPLIDTTSVDGVVNLESSFIDTFPSAARDYAEITKFVPSITGLDVPTASCKNCPSIRGEGQYGDNYMIDGLTIRDPARKTTGTPLPYDAIEEIQIITDGFSPEYGQAMGGTVNVITKSGTDQLDGEVAYLYTSDTLSNDFQEGFYSTPSEFSNSSPYVNVSGPIVKEKLRYFFSYNRGDSKDTYHATQIPGFGTLPEGIVDSESDIYFGQLTWAITQNHSISLNYTFRDLNVAGNDANRATPEARTGFDIKDDRLRLNYRALFSPNSVLELRLGQVRREDLRTSPTPREAAQYSFPDFGVITNNTESISRKKPERKDAALVYTHYLSAGGRGGHHEIKGGVEYHEPENKTEWLYNGTGEDVFSISPASAPDPGQPDRFNEGSSYRFSSVQVAPGQHINVPKRLNEYWSAGYVPNRSEEMGVFVQDRWEIGRVNLLLGVRWDKAKGYDNEDTIFYEYDWDQAIAPRFSLSWDITGDGKNILKAGWGRFFDTASTRVGEFANTAIPFGLRTYNWVGGATEDFESHIDDGGVLDIHNPDNWSFRFEQSNAATPADFEDMKSPARVDRWLLEYDRKLWDRYALKVRYVNGESRNLIDDVADPYPYYRFTNTDLKRRDYDSYELEFNGNPTPNLSFRTSYVHSMAKGTSPGQFEEGGLNDVSVFLDRPKSNPQLWCKEFDDPGTPAVECSPWATTDPTADYNDDGVVNQYDYDLYFQNLFAGLGSVDGDTEGWYGYLPYSIDDMVKLYMRLNVPKWGDMYFTTFARWSSGYHTQRKGYLNTFGGYYVYSEVPVLEVQCADPSNPTFATCAPVEVKAAVPGEGFSKEDGQRRGSEETPSFWSIDLSAGKMWSLSKQLAIETRVELFNVFNQQEPISLNDTASSAYGETLLRQPPRSARLFVRFSF